MQNTKTNKTSQSQDKPAPAAGGKSVWMSIIPIGIFIAVSFGLVQLANNQQGSTEKNAASRQAHNTEIGLPRDFPSDVIPLYKGVEVLETERTETMSTDGEPMDRWYIHAQIDSVRKPIFDYYHNLMLERGMAQVLFISVPAGDGSGSSFSANYADEELIAEFNIEKKSSDEITQVEITIYRLQ